MFSYLTLAQRIPADRPALRIRVLVDRALERMDAELEKLYSDTGRPSIAPERLLRATLLMVLYSIRSERLIEGAMSQRLLESVLVEAREHDLLSEEHFAVDGTLIQAWAAARSFHEKSDPARSRRGFRPQGRGAFARQGGVGDPPGYALV